MASKAKAVMNRRVVQTLILMDVDACATSHQPPATSHQPQYQYRQYARRVGKASEEKSGAGGSVGVETVE
eukprot:scaffold6107_cov130-Isochrysis_galbana.AAC.12